MTFKARKIGFKYNYNILLDVKGKRNVTIIYHNIQFYFKSFSFMSSHSKYTHSQLLKMSKNFTVMSTRELKSKLLGFFFRLTSRSFFRIFLTLPLSIFISQQTR